MPEYYQQNIKVRNQAVATKASDTYKLKPVAPYKVDPPGAIKKMPSPREMHHVHIFSDDNYDAMVEFYQMIFNGEITNVNSHENRMELTFITYDDHDHRVVVIKRPGWGKKPDRPVGLSHIAFAYNSLGELIYIYKTLKAAGYPPPHWTVNHGNSTSFYYKDPDGNEVETMLDNFSSLDTQDYKRFYQFTEDFGDMAEGNFDPDKMVELYESGVPDSVLLDREEVRRMAREGKL
jgi:catechol 2,3-dioxygenase-like lactoylglutathione lyase family enzyme